MSAPIQPQAAPEMQELFKVFAQQQAQLEQQQAQLEQQQTLFAQQQTQFHELGESTSSNQVQRERTEALVTEVLRQKTKRHLTQIDTEHLKDQSYLSGIATLLSWVPQQVSFGAQFALDSLKKLSIVPEGSKEAIGPTFTAGNQAIPEAVTAQPVSISTSCDPIAPENLQIVPYRGFKDPAPTSESFTLPTFPAYITESLATRNTMFFGLGAASSGLITTAVVSSPLLLILASCVGGVAFSIFSYNVESRGQNPIDLDREIFAHKPTTITTKEEALAYLQLPLDKINDKACIERRVEVLLKRYTQYLDQSTLSGPTHPLHALITTIVQHIKTSHDLLK